MGGASFFLKHPFPEIKKNAAKRMLIETGGSEKDDRILLVLLSSQFKTMHEFFPLPGGEG
ncbi:MAG: hypothetical protein A2351_07490 [Omnitrophica bacterium RIFOXYB12_FULL_50_7]|nr:MAG: hypothetical protein A2351_07490 [Omnitrophica bacterium RIFOXYB12_FULL_50_7]